MPTVITSSEWLSFDTVDSLPEVPLNTPAWKALDYTSLRRRVRVGEDRVVPGAAGRLAVAREWDELTTTIPMRIKGFRDWEGTAYGDRFLGVDLNHQYLQDNVFNVLDLRAVTFTDRHENEWTGSLFVQQWEPLVDPASGGDVIVGVLTVVIPAGMLTETGS
jgi:hypothetical protein